MDPIQMQKSPSDMILSVSSVILIIAIFGVVAYGFMLGNSKIESKKTVTNIPSITLSPSITPTESPYDLDVGSVNTDLGDINKEISGLQ